jgi:phage regulator Rha-like protein
MLAKEQTMSSIEIAELTGKRHDHVLRDCDVLNDNYDSLHLPKIGSMFNIRELNDIMKIGLAKIGASYPKQIHPYLNNELKFLLYL